MLRKLIVLVGFIALVSVMPKPLSVKELTPIVKATCQGVCEPGPKTK